MHKKVAYISPTFFSNVDVPFIQAMKDLCNIYYFAIVPFDGKGYAINIKNLPAKGGLYEATTFPELKCFEKIIDLNKTFIVYNKYQSSFSLANLRVTFCLMIKLLRLHCTLYHFTEPFRFCELPLFFFRKKSVFDVHDPFIHSSDTSWLVRIYRFLAFHLFNRFIIFNTLQRDAFITKYNLPEHRVYSSALSSYTYLRIFPQQTAPDYKYLLFTGTIRSHKGLEYLMEAMRFVHLKYPNYKLVIAGSGQFYFDISQYTKDNYYVIINKFLDDAEQVPLLAHAECIICPYIDATQSGVIMSAYAFDKPCIVTNVGGLPEMVGYGKYGIIVPPKAPLSLADAICEMIAQPNLRQQFSQQIHTDYTEGDRSWKYIANKIATEIYEDIC